MHGFSIMNTFNKITLVLFVLLTQACAINAPAYSPSYDNVQKLNQIDNEIQLLAFDVGKAGAARISVRGTSIISPYGSDFSDYLYFAIESELRKSKKLSDNSNIRLKMIVHEFKVDSTGGLSELIATVIVSSPKEELYVNRMDYKIDWDSSFIGAIAIPKSAESVKPLVTGFLGKLYSDPKFISAISN